MANNTTGNKQPINQTYDLLFKILLVGDTGVGKSSVLLRFTDDRYDDEQLSTIGVDLKVKYLDVRNKRIKCTIWDTAGQERFRTLTASYYRGSQATILVYDVTRKETFDSLQHWYDEITHHTAQGKIVKILVGNKIDLEKRQVSRQEGEAFAREHGMMFIECSAKSRVGIQQVFMETVNQILDMPIDEDHTTTTSPNTKSKIDVNLNNNQGDNSQCC
jgi:Ras-related protein Rab-18